MQIMQEAIDHEGNVVLVETADQTTWTHTSTASMHTRTSKACTQLLAVEWMCRSTSIQKINLTRPERCSLAVSESLKQSKPDSTASAWIMLGACLSSQKSCCNLLCLRRLLIAQWRTLE